MRVQLTSGDLTVDLKNNADGTIGFDANNEDHSGAYGNLSMQDARDLMAALGMVMSAAGRG